MDRLVEIFGKENVLKDEPMSRHTTFRIGGAADFFVKVQTISQLQEAMRYLKKEQIPFYIVGNGSNLLVRDEGVRGVVLQLGERFSGYEFLHETPGSVAQSGTAQKDTAAVSGAGQTAQIPAGTAVDKNQIVMVRAKAGSLLGRLGKEFAEYSLSGFEFASGIPGTLGGAVYMNAGAYGGEIKDILVRATLMDMDGSLFEFTNQQMQFGYRKSIAAEKNYIVLEADLALHVSSKEEVLAKMAELSAQRRLKQPLEYPSAGSTFKRPEGYFAGKLISDAGLKGFSVGGAQVSEKHAGFVINTGNATAADVIALTDAVRDKVFEKYGVKLELEIKQLG